MQATLEIETGPHFIKSPYPTLADAINALEMSFSVFGYSV